MQVLVNTVHTETVRSNDLKCNGKKEKFENVEFSRKDLVFLGEKPAAMMAFSFLRNLLKENKVLASKKEYENESNLSV